MDTVSTAESLANKHCMPCNSGMQALTHPQADDLLKKLHDWQKFDHIIGKTFKFKNHYETIAFVNAIAWMSHQEDHHPELSVTYNSCRVEYTTHAINGLSENDFICAAKIDRLFKH